MTGRADQGSFESLLEHRHDRTVPNVVAFKSRRVGVMEAQRLADEFARSGTTLWPAAEPLFERIKPSMEWRRKLRLAVPSVLILLGCVCFAVSLWPTVLPLIGCGLFIAATVINLVGCVR